MDVIDNFFEGYIKFPNTITIDFKVGDFWIEFFGLSGELKRYDELKERKLILAKKHKLNLIEIYPKDTFSLNENKFLPLEFLIR